MTASTCKPALPVGFFSALQFFRSEAFRIDCLLILRRVAMSTMSDRTQSHASSRENTDRRALVVGDTVRIAKGTLAWSAEKILRDKVGEVVSTYHVEGGTTRVTVRSSARRILEKREMSVFERVDREPA